MAFCIQRSLVARDVVAYIPELFVRFKVLTTIPRLGVAFNAAPTVVDVKPLTIPIGDIINNKSELCVFAVLGEQALHDTALVLAHEAIADRFLARRAWLFEVGMAAHALHRHPPQ